MIVIIGSVRVRPEARDVALALAIEHVHRSRAEPGCLSHGVHQDAEEPDTLVFVERWADLDAVRTHFAVPASGAFVAALGALATATPGMQVYDATPVCPQ